MLLTFYHPNTRVALTLYFLHGSLVQGHKDFSFQMKATLAACTAAGMLRHATVCI
jgi:hypothetical protein